MNGILVIDKPAGITSHDVVSRVRRILKTKRVGHTGTLDPFATGVMVILVGQATRLAQFLDTDEKEYEALIKFGYETDTGDRTGVQSAECGGRNEEMGNTLDQVDWDDVFSTFRGEIEQLPPMYSAKKIAGKKLYELARQGKTVERKAVRVNIQDLSLVAGQPPALSNATLRINVVCSAGTYIRTLAEDIGRKIGIGAHLEELRRTRAGKFTIEQSLTLDVLAENDDPLSHLISMDDAVSHLARVVLADDRAEKTRSGMSSRVQDPTFKDGQSVRLIDSSGGLIAIGKFMAEESSVQPKIVLI